MADDPLPTDSSTGDAGALTDPNATFDKSTIPAAIRRPDDTAPADSTPADAEEEALKKQRADYAEKQAALVQKIHDLDEKFKTQGEPLVNDINNSLANLDRTPPGELDSLSSAYKEENAKNTEEHGNLIMGGLFTLLGLGLTAFGGRRGWGARAGIWQGVGNAMTLYAKGKEEQSRDQHAKALKMISLVHQENQERLAQKREIIADKRLTATQKMDMLKVHHELYQEQHQQYRDEQSALEGETKVLQQQERALESLRAFKYKFHSDLSQVVKTKDGKAWAEYVYVTTKGEINPMRSREELAQAEELFPLEDYIKERHDVGKTDETGKEKTMTTPGKKMPEQTMQDKAKSFWGGQ